jgi:hypothetical protein
MATLQAALHAAELIDEQDRLCAKVGSQRPTLPPRSTALAQAGTASPLLRARAFLAAGAAAGAAAATFLATAFFATTFLAAAFFATGFQAAAVRRH